MLNATRLLLLLTLVGSLTLQGCQGLKVAPAQTRNQFGSLPKDATTPPEIPQFLPLFQNSVMKLEQRLESSETKLQDTLKQHSDKPTP